ncbi:cupin domain-containing protein [Chitinibacter sp. GC72]|uniref:cupin domain-containing protein n=1 Tax=Chitinibacter sp. GC72 TaxID=1526917 RepID=UPI0018DF570C|nr:cupin domain-containing protein [Chitinibacter sp. GC72]
MSDSPKTPPTSSRYQLDIRAGQSEMPAGLGKVLDILSNTPPARAMPADPSLAAGLQVGNLFADALPPLDGERFEPLHQQAGLLIERIISSARIAQQEYIQTQDEWVLLLQGEATLEVAGQNVALHAGDYLLIPAQTPHTVRRVSEGALWLAIHCAAPAAGGFSAGTWPAGG